MAHVTRVYDLIVRHYTALLWRHNERDGVSNHASLDSLLNRLFRLRSKKISKLRVTGICQGNTPVTVEFPWQRTSNAENVSILWRNLRHDYLERFTSSILRSTGDIECDISDKQWLLYLKNLQSLWWSWVIWFLIKTISIGHVHDAPGWTWRNRVDCMRPLWVAGRMCSQDSKLGTFRNRNTQRHNDNTKYISYTVNDLLFWWCHKEAMICHYSLCINWVSELPNFRIN